MSEDAVSAIHKLNTTARYTWNDPFIKVLREFRAIEICDSALAWCEAQYAANRQVTFGQAMQNYISDPDADPSWAAFNLIVFGKMLDKQLRLGYLAKLEASAVQSITTNPDLQTVLTMEELAILVEKDGRNVVEVS